MIHLLDRHPSHWHDWFREAGLPPLRCRQVRRWVFEQAEGNFQAMTDLPKPLRTELAERFAVWTTRVIDHRAADDGTEKLLLELADTERIECVLLRDHRRRRTACISTQVGCAMGCRFCASGLGGFVRNLSTGQIVEQLLRLKSRLGPQERLSHIVVMGMGEPLLNLRNLLPALAVATAPEGLGIGARRITISTVGLPKGIRQLARHHSPYHLAVSLHAPTDRLRSRIVPSNRKVGIRAILAAADEYFRCTGRRVTYEYVLLAGVNDQPKHARQLAELLRGRPALVNLIPLNPVAELPDRPPAAAVVHQFARELENLGIVAKIRHRKGNRIDAACGQLRRQSPLQPPTTASGLAAAGNHPHEASGSAENQDTTEQ